MSSQGFKECSSQITNSINTRIYDRNIPSHVLQPYVSVRPVMTKYSIMPIVDPRTPVSRPLTVQPVYNTEQVFNPGNNQAPWSGFATNINTESELRNQIYALQSCSQSVYVPSSNSDLYTFHFTNKNSNAQQPFPGLFQKDYFSPFNPNPENIGQGVFQNYTRQQTKDISPSDC
uniref:Uncharacterized protein n=1 Tax=viral metagenome TaxID=1070528 RepID=A0A6C0B0B6_9ZZZZ